MGVLIHLPCTFYFILYTSERQAWPWDSTQSPSAVAGAAAGEDGLDPVSPALWSVDMVALSASRTRGRQLGGAKVGVAAFGARRSELGISCEGMQSRVQVTIQGRHENRTACVAAYDRVRAPFGLDGEPP